VRLDPVHDLQAVFRELMAAMASPGTVRSIGEQASRIDIEPPVPPPVLAAAMALLDAETVFCVRSSDGRESDAGISRLTSARRGPIEDSDFILVIGGVDEVARSIELARGGTLIDPHLGATLIVLAGSVEPGGELALAGPGVLPGARLGLGLGGGSGGRWLEARAAKNREYPLGVDMIFVDPEGRLAALPRTTIAEGLPRTTIATEG
jgi:alpha-D-ribose 1-methylphosphonate 5-triphosphate synthase subunit PhnH